mmetsp:Transcript_7351/g.22408  ORF Transcript_7351/g.22408 Transcript_7351/m.22408 type:complete len:390 (-) Transcript_7351:155-1324(-)
MDEEQFVLRLPPVLAEKLRFALLSKAKEKAAKRGETIPTFSIKWIKEREAIFNADGVDYPATLMDLPTICETHKTADKKTYYKSADLHQVLVVRMPDDASPESILLRDGLTPAAKNAGIRMAPMEPIYSPEKVSNVENQLKYVLDKKIAFVQKTEETAPEPTEEVEIVEEEAENQPALEAARKDAQKKDVKKKVPSGEKEANAAAKPAAGHSASSKAASKREEKAPAASTKAPRPMAPAPKAADTAAETAAGTAGGTAAKPANERKPESESKPAETGPAPSQPAVAAAKAESGKPPLLAPPPSAPSTQPTPAAEDKDSTPMEIDHMAEAQKKAEYLRLEKLVKEQEAVVKDAEAQVNRQGNPVMKRRLQGKLDEAKKLLEERENALKSL